jgi:hypothetical protein
VEAERAEGLPTALPTLPPEARIVRDAWHLMGGLDWAAFPQACELLGVRDPEWLLAGLVAMRDWFAERQRRRDEERGRLNQQGRA